jgi:amino acid permease
MMPYILYLNGFVAGSMMIAVGAAVSYYTGSLIAECAEYCNASRYEDIAM